MLFSFRSKVNFGFVLASLFLTVISLYAYRNTDLLVKNAESVSHTHEVKQTIEKIISEMKDIETGQRGYVITGDEEYLVPHEAAILTIERTLETLRGLTSDNSNQQALLNEFIALKDQKIAQSRESIEKRKASGFEATRKFLVGNSGKVFMDKMRDIASRMQSEEDRLLKLRNASAEESTRMTMTVIVGGGVIALLIILGALVVLNRAESARIIVSRKVESQNKIRAGLIELNEKMGGDQSLSSLAKNVIEKISEFLDAKVGALYLTDESGLLRLESGFAFQPANGVGSEFKPGEGLVGQAAAQRAAVTVADAPEDYFRVRSGLGESNPKFIHVAPFLHDGRVKGVVELGTFSPFSKDHLEFLDLGLDRVAVAFNSAQARLKVAELLQETQAQTEELQSQQEELRATNEELGNKTQELEAQQEELRQINEELESQAEIVAQASRYKSEFLANMSHELRTPLNSQLILSQILAENEEGNLTAKQKEFAQSIHSTGLDLLQLINDILDLSKVEAGKLDVDIRDFPLQSVIADCERTFRTMAEKKGLTFKVDVDPSIPKEIRSDSHRLSQIVKNFLSNSFKFTSAGEIRLHVGRSDAGFLAFRVSDTGIGVAADKMEKIFESFEQVDNSISRQYGGTGLGLSICKKLAKLLGGEVRATSELGKGSTFTLLIPETLTSAAAHTPQVRDAAPGAPISILIVDDNEVLAGVFADVVKRRGHLAHVASTGADALKFIESHKPAGVLLDSHLPDMSGLEILKTIKSNPATSHIAVYMVSGDGSGAAAKEHGAIGFLMKPTTSKDIARAVEEIKTASQDKKQRVLVVDDEDIQLSHMERLLGSERVSVTTAKSAEEAMRLIESLGAFDCIVLDLRLPDMTGFHMLERLSEQNNRIPIIIHTAKDLDKSEEAKLRKYSESIIIKGERSSERLVDEVTLFLRKGKSEKPAGLFGVEAVFKGKNVLIADDDDRNIFALTNALQAKGLTISNVHNGQEALDALSGKHAFDLVLMDVMMPVMDGNEAMRRIRALPHGGEIPIIALTANAMKGSREACIAAGANDYLSKPVNMERLLSLLRVWLARK